MGIDPTFGLIIFLTGVVMVKFAHVQFWWREWKMEADRRHPRLK
jgi:hypothetical protein